MIAVLFPTSLEVFFQIQLIPNAAIPPIVFTIEVLRDTGSGALNLYERDLVILDPGQLYPRSLLVSFATANGLVNRQTTMVMAVE